MQGRRPILGCHNAEVVLLGEEKASACPSMTELTHLAFDRREFGTRSDVGKLT
jgi:hypothetical protein